MRSVASEWNEDRRWASSWKVSGRRRMTGPDDGEVVSTWKTRSRAPEVTISGMEVVASEPADFLNHCWVRGKMAEPVVSRRAAKSRK